MIKLALTLATVASIVLSGVYITVTGMFNDPPAFKSGGVIVRHIEEDEPGWDCATMGNRVCGESATAEFLAAHGVGR